RAPLDLFLRQARNRLGGDFAYQPKCRASPLLAHDGNVPAHQSDGFRGPPRVHSLHDAVVDHHFRHAFRVARSVSDRSRAAGRGAEGGVAAKGQCINDGFQITLKRRKRKVRDVPIGETKTATVVANELEPACEELPKLRPDRIVPVVLEMSSPGRGAHEWHTA